MKRQILKTILLALPKVLTYKARRFPAFRERLKQRNLAVRIERATDGAVTVADLAAAAVSPPAEEAGV